MANSDARKKKPGKAASETKASVRRASTNRSSSTAKKSTAQGGKKKTAASGKKKFVVQDNPLNSMRSAPRKPSAAVKKVPQKKNARRKKKRESAVSWLTPLLVAGIVVMGFLFYRQYQSYAEFCVMRDTVESQTFYQGTLVEGVDVSGMTLEQALTYWSEQVEPQYTQRTLTLENGASITAGELGYSSDYADVLSNAWSAGRSGSLEQRYNALSQRQSQPMQYGVTRKLYDEDVVQMCVAQVAAQIDKPATDAKIATFDTSSYTFTFTDAETGSQLDQDALASEMMRVLDAGGGEVQWQILAVQPEVTKDDIASQYGLITYASTNASSSSKNRLANISLALSFINGTCLQPGESFSFNGTVGKRTTDRGFKKATAYSGGTVTEEVGGGICQVSTTLFNAAVKADLQIDERHCHSLTVGYVDKGKDAAVNWDSQDLRFTNNGDDAVYICCFLSDDKRVRVGIFGKLLPDGETITVESEITKTIDYEIQYQMDFTMMSGATAEIQAGKNGYEAVAYKVRWDKDGNQIGSELLCKSAYKSVPQIIAYGP